MPRTPNKKYREEKINKILESARLVFCRKGFLAVSMQDIIDECGISRGGIYLYFSSVDEILRVAVRQRDKEKFNDLRAAIDAGKPFSIVLEEYLALQKNRLLHMENSLFRAVCEYNFNNPGEVAQEFRDTQVAALRKSVLSILNLGVRQKVIRGESITALADHFIVTIDGLGIFALARVLTEEVVDAQFAILGGMIESIKV